ncbi:MAG: site-specific integrase [Defluviitaleaceae bacterium]|nr:site-specific integrase [Defluviitaleaceae bacterium]
MARKTNTEINGNNYFRVTATVGKNPDGTLIRKQFYGESKKEAENKRDEYMSNIKQGLSVNYDKAMFGIAFKSWLQDVLRPSVSISTYSRYELEYKKRIMECGLSSLRITEIRSANVQAYYNLLLETCTPKTVQSVHKLLVRFFNYCLKADMIIKSPLLAVELPAIEKHSETNKAIKDADIDKLLYSAKENIKNFIFVFAMFTGLREGEILALTHKDINIDEGTIDVNKTVKYLNVDGVYQPVLSSPKTKHSKRTVPILGAIKKLLKTHIAREMEKHLRLGIPFSKDSILFSSDACTYKEAPNVLKMLRRLCIKLDIEKTTFHSLRHTFCTILAKQGVPLKTTSVLMGHTDIAITARIYTHVDDTEKRKGIERLSAYFH